MASSENSNPPLGAGEGRLPHEDFPEEPLVHEREGRADGSERCLLYPADAAPWEIQTHWFAVDADTVVDLEARR